MEEDIKVTDINVGELEIDIKAIKSSLKELETERDDIQLICIKAELELSIENIINRLEQLEEENKEMKTNNKITYEYNHVFDLDDYIPKSVIREKIEELEKNLSSVKQMNESMARFTTIQKLDYQIQILKELLGEE